MKGKESGEGEREAGRCRMPTIHDPEFLRHGDEACAIYSLCVSPDGSKLATGGQDCKVRLWSMEAIYREEEDLPNKLLSTISHHNGAVNCVRWSPCGKYLATCSDDCTVMVLQKGASLSYVPLGETTANAEHWETFRVFRSHTKDIMHVEWSPDGTRLASCGLDNKVVVWSLTNADGAPKELRGHNGMVKGVSWDPAGKYLATQGDGGEEQAVVIWRVRDWKMESKTHKPFKHAPDETMFLRLSWSPDGQYIAGTNAYIKKKNACALLERPKGEAVHVDSGEWKSTLQFVGNLEPVVVATFHPKLLARSKANGTEVIDMVCAVGGGDRSLTLWSSSGNTPIFVLNNLFDKQVRDQDPSLHSHPSNPQHLHLKRSILTPATHSHPSTPKPDT